MKLKEIPIKTYCEFKKGEYIIHQNERIEYVYKIISGVCYRTDTSERGSEIVYEIKSSASKGVESILGSLVVFSGGISTCNFVAHTKICCYKIPCDVFYNYVISNSELCVEMLQLALKNYQAVKERYRAKSYGNTFSQLCKLMLEHSGYQDDELVVASFNNKLLSQYLGIHQVTVSKMLKYLKADGVIEKGKKGLVILDAYKLNKYANMDGIVYW